MDEALRGGAGGILTLLATIEQHKDAFHYDWRTRFGQPLSVVGNGMDWAEACGLFRRLCLDPSSHVASSIAWQNRHLPRSKKRADVERIYTIDTYALADLIDTFAAAHFKRWKPYPRPSDPPAPHTRAELPQTDIRAALKARGH